MSERERWIVYPLLFFALGASLRDKLTQTVQSKEVFCQSLKIVDPHSEGKILAELSAESKGPLEGGEQMTVFRADNMICNTLSVMDAKEPDKQLVFIGTGLSPYFAPGEQPKRVGAIILRDSESKLTSEIRTDQFRGSRFVCNQMFVLDPQNERKLVQIGTEAMPAISLNEEDPAVSHQGVIILNNRYLGVRLAPPSRKPAPQ